MYIYTTTLFSDNYTLKISEYWHMGTSFTFVVMVLVLVAVVAGVALPEITDRLLTTQASAQGISVPLDMAITSLSYFLPIGYLGILTALVTAFLRR